MSLIDVIFLISAGLTLGFLGIGVRFLRSLHISVESRLRRFDSFVSARGDEPSNLALVFDAMVERAYSKVAGSQMGVASGVARSEKSAQIDYIKQVVANEQPMVAMALDQVMPKWGKMLANNPKMIDQLMGYLGSMKGKQEAPSANGVQEQLFTL